ncbi:MAG: DNA polymerase domain-containing protein, partial [Anaerolineaceae bacterium]
METSPQTLIQHSGWLLDLYAGSRDGLVVWFIGEDGLRYRLKQDFPVTFYAAAPPSHLSELAGFAKRFGRQVEVTFTRRRELFSGDDIPVLAIRVASPAQQPAIFHQLAGRFPAVIFYDADIPLMLRYAALHGTFPLAYCTFRSDPQGNLHDLEVLDSPWDLNPPVAPLRVLILEPNVNPSHAAPEYLVVKDKQHGCQLDFSPARPFLLNVRALLQQKDPDLLLTRWGDTWLLPKLLKLSEEFDIPLPLNRDAGSAILYRPERSYFAYNQIIHRGQQMHLSGRWHIDAHNAMMWGDYGLEGVFELARVTGLPMQTTARVSPGTGISAMQMTVALRDGILIPWHKQQAEDLKSAAELFSADQGGLVYQPTIGLHRDVGEIDFVSMYPSVMVHFNISPETVGADVPSAETIPSLGLKIDRQHEGLIPRTLRPLLEKRVSLKRNLTLLPVWDPRRKRYKACTSAHKWLLVTCFGYLGYKNARFGRIEAHQAVTAYGREALLEAKEAAEQLGFTVLHMYVDGMWVKKDGASTSQDFQPVLDAILERTGLPISLDGVYRWVAFLPSRRDARVAVPNRYFGVFQDGTLKMRGIEARRGDTTPFIARTQLEMIELLARAGDAARLEATLPQLAVLLRRRLRQMYSLTLPLEDFLVTLRVSRNLDEFRVPSPAAQATAQLAAIGKNLRPGQHVRLLLTRGEPGVHAWDLPQAPLPSSLDLERYRVLLLRAATTVLQPLGLPEDRLESFIAAQEHQSLLPGMRQA